MALKEIDRRVGNGFFCDPLPLPCSPFLVSIFGSFVIMHLAANRQLLLLLLMMMMMMMMQSTDS